MVGRIFLDANVLISIAYGSPGLKRLEERTLKKHCLLFASNFVIEEAKRNLSDPPQIKRLGLFLSNIQIIPEMDPQTALSYPFARKRPARPLGCHFHQGRLPFDGRYYSFREIFWKEGKRCDHLFTPRLSKHPTFGRLMVLRKLSLVVGSPGPTSTYFLK